MLHDREGPTRVQMEQMALAVLESLPEKFRNELGDVVLRVEDFATPEQLASVDLADKWELSGLYEGRALPDQSIWESGRMPPRIWLFRRVLIAGQSRFRYGQANGSTIRKAIPQRRNDSVTGGMCPAM